jgi:mitochondrial fission protein ELM1
VTPASCWILSVGHAGLEAQGRGLAQALDVEPIVKKVRPVGPWRYVPKGLWPDPLRLLSRKSDQLSPPWPDLLISCGHLGIAFAVAIKRASGGRTRAVHIQNPGRWGRGKVDLSIVPKHDGITGPDIFVSEAALHPVTPARLAEGASAWRERFADLPRPLLALLIGGSNGRHRLTDGVMRDLAERLVAAMRRHGAGLAVTPSRRTDPATLSILTQAMAGMPAYVWDGRGANPYFGMLALADAIVVTEDSVSMATEACATGKPVYIAALEGASRRIRAFHDDLRAAGMTRPFTGELAQWRYDRPDDTERAAAEIRRRFGW